MRVRTRDALGYALLPGIIPRLRGLGVHFGFVAYLMALIYATARLLPLDHPYLNPSNIGRYSIRQVFAAAAWNLKFRWANIDQIIVYFVLLAAFVILVVQFALMFAWLFVGFSHAGPALPPLPPWRGIFNTPQPANDIAFMFLDRLFGVPGFFGSCISDLTVTCESTGGYIPPAEPSIFPAAFQIAMIRLFAFYSWGMLLIALLIIIYFIMAVLMESVQSGVPFGRRFATFYAPVRFCLAILVLVPLPTAISGNSGILGYNAAQYLTLALARAGSGLATNAWNTFNISLITGGQERRSDQQLFTIFNLGTQKSDGTKTPNSELLVFPKAQKLDPLIKFFYIAQTCRAAYKRRYKMDIQPYLVNGSTTNGSSSLLLDATVTFDTAWNFSRGGSFIVSFGAPVGADGNNTQMGGIKTFCGQVSIEIHSITQPGAKALYEKYLVYVQDLWNDEAIRAFGERIAMLNIPGSEGTVYTAANAIGCIFSLPTGYEGLWPNCGSFPDPRYFYESRDTYQARLISDLTDARTAQLSTSGWVIDPKILSRGWAGAGIWYNRLAVVNGAVIDAARNPPRVSAMPFVMEQIRQARESALDKSDIKDVYTAPTALEEGKELNIADMDVGIALNRTYKFFQNEGFTNEPIIRESNNMIYKAIDLMFGAESLFEMRENQELNPLVQVIGLGRSIVEHTIGNLLYASTLEFAGGALTELQDWKKVGGGMLNISGAWFSVTMIGLGVGILLYYVIPFMPFIYFFFSVVKWAMSIFEAMIGMPLWALAHLRIDGDGIPGDAAMNGYFLLLEIFLRPILTIIGLVCSFSIFVAMAYTMNDLFNLLFDNLGGFSQSSTLGGAPENRRGPMDLLFFNIVYAALIYIFAVTSFKLIDLIPANVLRWLGSGVKNIIDDAGDPVPSMIKTTLIGSFGMPLIQSSGMVGQAVGGLRGGIRGMGSLSGEVVENAMNSSKPNTLQDVLSKIRK